MLRSFLLSFDNSNSHLEVCVTLMPRIVRFALVGTVCFFVQWGTMQCLHLVMHIFYADMVAFVVSAQLNFILSSRFTWRDRNGTRRILARWGKFNTSVILVASINAGILWLLVSYGFWHWSALIIASSVSILFTFSVNHFVVFRKENDGSPAQPGIFRAGIQRG